MDPDKVQGDIQRPFQQDPEASDKIDPEKFKKVMKVEDTDEAQKRNKRNLKREEEEGEDEDVEEKVAPPPSSTSFSEFMNDKDQLSNVLDSESGGVRYQKAPEEDDAFIAPEAGSINTEGVELDESEAPPPPQPQGQPQTGSGQEQAPPPSQQHPPAGGGYTQEQAPPPQPQGQPQTGSGQEQAPPPQQHPPAGGGYTQEPPESDDESFSPPTYEGDFEQQPFQQQQSQDTTSEDTQNAQNTQQAQQPQKKQKGDEKPPEKKKEEDASLLASQPKRSDLIPKKKKKTKKPAAEVKTLPKEMQKQKPSEGTAKPSKLDGAPLPESNVGKNQASAAPFEGAEKMSGEGLTALGRPKGDNISMPGDPSQKTDAKKTSPFRRLTPQELRNQRLGKEGASTTAALEGMVVPSAGEGQKGEMDKKKKNDDDSPFIEATSETASITLPTFETPIAPVAETQATPSYTRLTPEVHELFEKMGGVMVVQLDKGVTTTTMNINMPNSVFNGTQVILDQYSSAPHAYNLQLIGSPEAVKLFTSNMGQLENSFKQANFNFEVNILNPSITQTKKPPHLIRRGSSAGGKGGGGSGGGKGKSGN